MLLARHDQAHREYEERRTKEVGATQEAIPAAGSCWQRHAASGRVESGGARMTAVCCPQTTRHNAAVLKARDHVLGRKEEDDYARRVVPPLVPCAHARAHERPLRTRRGEPWGARGRCGTKPSADRRKPVGIRTQRPMRACAADAILSSRPWSARISCRCVCTLCE